MTKSATATPGFVDGHVSTVNMEGSYKIIVCITFDQRVTSLTNSMIKGDSVDHHKLAKVIFVWVIVSMPGDHIKW